MNPDDVIKMKMDIVRAGKEAVKELIKIAEEKVIKEAEVDIDGNPISKELAADRLKNAAATKKLAIFDALDILARVESTENEIRESQMGASGRSLDNLAENRAK